MPRYDQSVIEKIRHLRSLGNTYGEIRVKLNKPFPKSSLSDICRNVQLPPEYRERLIEFQSLNTSKGRAVALEVNRVKRIKYFEDLTVNNSRVAEKIEDIHTAKIALAMLCLGEASKYKGGRSFYLGNSDPRIIIIFLSLLKNCFPFNVEKVRCTVQCREDQDPDTLQKYWMTVTGIPGRLFYKPLIDLRTKGKPTKRSDYKGVLRIDYFDIYIQHELESLANLVYNHLVQLGPVVYR